MTRELKLALIVGFALVLGVTVLISDHLSKARTSGLETAVAQQPSLTPNPPAGPVANTALNEPAPSTPFLPDAAPTHPADAPVSLTQSTGADPLQDAVRKLGGDIQNGEIRLPGLAGVDTAKSDPATPSPTPVKKDNLYLDPTAPVGGKIGVHIPVSPVTPSPTPEIVKPVKLDPVKLDPAPASFRDYTVAEGDSAYRLAKRFLGNGESWKKLAELNPGKIGPAGQLKVGARLRIPADAAAKPAPTDRLTAKPDTKPDAAKTSARDAKPAPRTYTVKKGDTLGLIAQRELKSAKRAGEILALNRAVISDEDDIPLGAVLKLPGN